MTYSYTCIRVEHADDRIFIFAPCTHIEAETYSK